MSDALPDAPDECSDRCRTAVPPGSVDDGGGAGMTADDSGEASTRTLPFVELLHRVSAAANEADTVEEAIDTIVADVCRTLGWDVGHAFLPDPDEHGVLVSSHIWYAVDDDRAAVLRALTQSRAFPVAAGIAGRALGEGAPVWIPDVEADPTHLRARMARECGLALGMRTHAAFPVSNRGNVVAVLEFFSMEGREHDARSAAIAEAIGGQLGRVLERREVQRSLAEARDAALEASRLKSEFLATMSHEIRTPMNAVIGMTGLLLDTELDSAQRRYATSVRVAAESLMTILNDILDFSKLEAGRFQLEAVDLQIDRILEEVADLLDGSTLDKPVDVFSYCHPNTPTLLRGDAGRVRQVLLNLIGNAVKFTPEGEVIVRVKPVEGSVSSTSACLRFEVVDTGIGIADQVRTRLFEPFEQGDRSTTRRFGGTGLGLSICRRIVELMGGEIGVESTLGEGSTFWFTVPFERRAADTVVEHGAVSLRGRRVLVLDDNATNRAIVQEQVAAWGMRPDAVATGTAALAALDAAEEEGSSYDIALLDLNMPEMDGIEVARRIAKDPRHEGVRVAMLTSSEGADEALRARQAGVQILLRKPVRQSQLYDAVMELLLPGSLPARETAVSSAAPLPMGRGRVLLVEDNVANQIVGSKMTERWGYRVDVVADGQEALDALARQSYDAILMDCQMPVMDGYEATRRIRATTGPASRVPVIAMTASAMLEDRQRCTAAGMDDFITKPVHPEDLGMALARWIPAADDPANACDAGADPADAREVASGVPGADGLPLLDDERWAMLVELTASRPAALSAMVDAFLGDASARLEHIRSSTADGAALAVAERAAHSLKGSAATLGLRALADDCERIETLLRGGSRPQLADVLGLAASLEHASAALRDAHTAALQRSPG
jgi:two-component system, sensor histidine kinase and response regulator